MCCDLKLMDATGRVVIETGRQLKPGTYRAFSVRLCTRETVLIQLWTLLPSNRAQLKWLTSFTATVSQNAPTFVTVKYTVFLTPFDLACL